MTEAGMRHLTLAYDSVDKMFATLEAAGAEIVERPRNAVHTEMISRVAFVRDPDGTMVELIERAAGR
jgi:glyoxylase I family protein